MDIWLPFDVWLIGKFEKFSHWFQHWTGKTNYFLCSVCSWAVIIASVIEYAAVNLPKGKSIDVLAILIILIFLVDISYLLPREEQRAFERVRDGVANPEKIAPDALVRRFLLLVVVCSFNFSNVVILLAKPLAVSGNGSANPGLYFLVVFSAAIFSRAYFYVCDPLPPCKGRVWDVIGAFFAKPAMIEIKNP